MRPIFLSITALGGSLSVPRRLPEAGHAVQSRVLSASCIIIQSGRWTGRARPDGVRTPRRITAVRIVSLVRKWKGGRQAEAAMLGEKEASVESRLLKSAALYRLEIVRSETGPSSRNILWLKMRVGLSLQIKNNRNKANRTTLNEAKPSNQNSNKSRKLECRKVAFLGPKL